MSVQEQSLQPSDWRLKLFGPDIRLNSTKDVDEESPISTLPTEVALNDDAYRYIAVFIGADYCPHCKAFAPTVNAATDKLQQKGCKVIFVSNDRDEVAFDASCKKNSGIDVMPYDTSRTRYMRDLFDLKTIPALMILRNNNFKENEPQVISNARHSLVGDPELENFPWAADSEEPKGDERMSAMDRIIIRGKYGKWWELGHHVNPEKPDDIYMDEHAVRIRAGILNVITWIALMNVFFWKDQIYVKILFPLVAFEFLSSLVFGLTPIAPIGFLGSVIAVILHPQPHFKPARPKRFAWLIGLLLATTCFIFFLNRKSLGEAYKPLVATVVMTCNVFTWLESSCGFCFGCFVYNEFLTKWFNLEECSECKL